MALKARREGFVVEEREDGGVRVQVGDRGERSLGPAQHEQVVMREHDIVVSGLRHGGVAG